MKAIIEEFQQTTGIKPISDVPETLASFNERRIEYLDALAKWLINTKIKVLQDEINILRTTKEWDNECSKKLYYDMEQQSKSLQNEVERLKSNPQYSYEAQNKLAELKQKINDSPRIKVHDGRISETWLTEDKWDNKVIAVALLEIDNVERLLDPIDVCGDCKFYTGEECDGMCEGSEVYDDTDACEGFEQNSEG